MSGPDPYVPYVPAGPAPDRHRGLYDYSSPNSTGGGEEQQAHQQRHQSRSRVSSIAFNHQQPQSPPQAFDNMTSMARLTHLVFHVPTLGENHFHHLPPAALNPQIGRQIENCRKTR
ncbi:hypothetical protein B0H14DRAFT_2567382 [Mycena olivaceomarginata]|nr:hypothetical protein B0H14DRAFT_2567382 [Mycena olivaceomarginata]